MSSPAVPLAVYYVLTSFKRTADGKEEQRTFVLNQDIQLCALLTTIQEMLNRDDSISRVEVCYEQSLKLTVDRLTSQMVGVYGSFKAAPKLLDLPIKATTL